jgi:hypothetical protein
MEVKWRWLALRLRSEQMPSPRAAEDIGQHLPGGWYATRTRLGLAITASALA